MSDYIAHYGVKGQRWGRRRYQNKDGSLTPDGKKRYNNTDTNLVDQDGNDGKSSERIDRDIKATQNITRNVNDIARVAQNASKRVPNKTKQKMDLSNMTDQEMRERINRAMLEKQYNDVFAPEKVNKGKERFEKFLDGSMTALQITSSALGIALSIRALMKE